MKPFEKNILLQIRDNPAIINHIENPSTKFLCVAICINPHIIEFINKQFYIVCLRANGLALEYVKDRTVEIELAAVKQNGNAIQFVAKPSYEVQLAAVKQNGNAIQFIEQPSRDIQIAALKQNMKAYNLIKNPDVDTTNMFFEFNKNITYAPGIYLVR